MRHEDQTWDPDDGVRIAGWWFLHGTRDEAIPYQHALDLKEGAGGAVELVTFDGAYHCGGYFADRPGYIRMVDEFLRRDRSHPQR